ncbi:hypothetical protein OC846_005449 [Tilletia horrida]|uniref:Uncharacterized protein n=1 Tax=Tilletia horrida TaxID=155126 RepID=A0AAN6JVZ4_9BASI|nr:hypothetical protein OC846_005449 [Tilletia horrida]KAK0561053.1 hypothetical protein OC861_006001 [Tilletia horrida]
MSRNLTHQLAETAVGVREVSKQLCRARVQLDSSVRSVLIITKARDNHLIRLTRQLALWLLLNKRPGQQRGLVVYVDAQLRGSKRFDAQGIRTEYPHLFQPAEVVHPKTCIKREERQARTPELHQQQISNDLLACDSNEERAPQHQSRNGAASDHFHPHE